MTTATKYKTYPKYKPSGIDWLGDIPADWKVKDLKYLLDRNDGGVWGEDFDDEGTPVLRSTEIDISGEWKLDEFARRKLTPQEKQKALLKEGDLLITKSSGSELHIGKTALVNKEIDQLECCFSNFMQRLRPNKYVSSKLLFYFFNSYIAREQYNYFSQSTTGLANLSEGLFGQIIFVKIPESEQKQIVAFLDRETAKIDEMVAKKQRMIDLLKEKRQALITHAVTKGLDPKAKMKPSGIDWLGDIPEGWEVKKAKFLSDFVSGYSFDSDSYVDDGVPIIRIGDIAEIIDFESVKKVPAELSIGLEKFSVKNGDILLALTGATIGKSAIYNSAEVALLNQRVAILRGKKLDQKYLTYFIASSIFKENIDYLCFGGAQENIGKSEIGAIIISYPKIDEQKEIVAFLDRETAKIDEMMKKVEMQIEKLQEYRQALITSAVTGKIMVN